MATLIDELIDVFNKQLRLYEDVLAIGKEKKNVILKNDIETLAQMNEVESSIVNKLNRLEKQRLLIISDMCEVLDINKDTFTLKELSEKLTIEEDKEKILNIRDELNAMMKELRVVNELNQTLIENSLEYINFSLNLYQSGAGQMQVGYQDDIKKKK